MLRTLVVLLLVVEGLTVGADAAKGQSINLTPGSPLAPAPGGTVWSFPGSGTFMMGFGTKVSKIKVTLQERRADGIWYNVVLGQEAQFQLNPPNPGMPESGGWSITMGAAKNVAFQYQMKTILYKQKADGTFDPLKVAESDWQIDPG